MLFFYTEFNCYKCSFPMTQNFDRTFVKYFLNFHTNVIIKITKIFLVFMKYN